MEKESKVDDFGFTNDERRFQDAVEFRKSLQKDGWTTSSPTPQGTESTEIWSKHEKEGFIARILTRTHEPNHKFKYQVTVSLWGPDRLAIKPPYVYDWEFIKAGVRTCNECGAQDVETFRFSFAGRACAKCIPALKEKYEKPGWCD